MFVSDPTIVGKYLYPWKPDLADTSTESGKAIVQAVNEAWRVGPAVQAAAQAPQAPQAAQAAHAAQVAHAAYAAYAVQAARAAQAAHAACAAHAAQAARATSNPAFFAVASPSSLSVAATVLYSHSPRQTVTRGFVGTAAVVAIPGQISSSENDLEGVLRELQGELRNPSTRSDILIRLLAVLKRDEPTQRAVRSYACCMRLLPDLLKNVRDELLIRDLARELHRCLTPFLNLPEGSCITMPQAGAIFRGLRIYAMLQTWTTEDETFLYRHYGALSQILDRHQGNIEYLTLASIFDTLTALRPIFPLLPQVTNFARQLIEKINPSGERARGVSENPTAQLALRAALCRYGCSEKDIKNIMQKGYPKNLLS